MQALFEMNEGRKRLEEILNSFPPDSAHWNEANNRFQFIDRLLIECLGWQHPFMDVEHIDEGGERSDYRLGKPTKAVVEAKREAVKFELLPVGKPTSVRKLRPLIEACKNLKHAVLQVIPYCVLNGAQIAVICNGPQLLIFQAVIVGQSPLDGECYIFNGFDQYVSNFALLWTLLSPEGVAENKAYRELSIHRNPRIPPKASTSLSEPLRYRYRSNFQDNLKTLASLLLEDIESHPSVKSDFYRECYVPLDANNRHLILSKNIIEARYRRAAESNAPPAASALPVNGGKIAIDPDVIAESMGARPIVVLGDIGVGKTSFFENLYEKLDEGDKDSNLFIQLDLGSRATLTENLKLFVVDEIKTILNSRYAIDIDSLKFAESVHYKALRRFEAGAEGEALRAIDETAYKLARVKFIDSLIKNRDVHVISSLSHLCHGQGKQIILVIDNADQRNFEIQQEAFLIAQELAASRSMLVFVSLRPSTFYASKTSGSLAAYQSKVLTISPPPADEVLRKRISFALRVAEGTIAPVALSNIRLQLVNIVSFLQATLRAIKGNEKIRTFLSNIAGGNTRLVVELVSSFCGSPNVESERIVRIEQETGSYQIPLHEFTKHALLGEYSYYNAQSSFFAFNLFDINFADPREHFLAAMIISFLSATNNNKDNDGFMPGVDVINELRTHGYIEDQIRLALRKLATKRLIETPHAHFREIIVENHDNPDKFMFRSTSIGIYHLRYWFGTFSFLDAMSTDTPIFDDQARSDIFSLAGSFEIADRLRRADAFRKYLIYQWGLANISCLYLDLPRLFETQSESFDTVRRHLEGGGRKPRRGRPWGKWAS